MASDHLNELRRKVGQLFIVDLDGKAPSSDIRRWLANFRPGGIILRDINYESPRQLAEFISFIQTSDQEVPLFITVDQEGGRVNRLKTPFTQFPAAADLGKLGSDVYAFRVGLALGRELTAVGINMNMAPVLDVNTNPLNPVIGDRSFGNNPKLVATLGAAYMHGLDTAGLVAVGKHFPGHGDTALDSHITLPKVEANNRRLNRVELRPFRTVIEQKISALMTGHVVYTAWDEDSPATLSPYIISRILRKKLGFTGLVISDDLTMGAIMENYSIERASLAAVEAGVDVLLICSGKWAYERAFNTLLKAFEKRELDPERLFISLGRVLKLKSRIVKGKDKPRLDLNAIGGAEQTQLVAELTREIEKKRLRLPRAL